MNLDNNQQNSLNIIGKKIIESITTDYKAIYKTSIFKIPCFDGYIMQLKLDDSNYTTMFKNNIGWNRNFVMSCYETSLQMDN